ncbi:MAG: hypothetical protein J4431_00120 [Candidatus Aenigmarchaeota archaeon]|nr:hypothetical protein [Candidatus Aenigmarchaeota archaeon]
MQIPEITGPDYGLRTFLKSEGGKYGIAWSTGRGADVLHIRPERQTSPFYDMEIRVAMQNGAILGMTSGCPQEKHEITRAMLNTPYGPLLIRADKIDDYFSIRFPAALDMKDFRAAVNFPEEPKPGDVQVTYPEESLPEILTATPRGEYLIISNHSAQLIDKYDGEIWLHETQATVGDVELFADDGGKIRSPETPAKGAGRPVYRYGIEGGMPYLSIWHGNDVTTVSPGRLPDYGEAMEFSAYGDWYVAGRHFPVPLLWAPRAHLTGSYL